MTPPFLPRLSITPPEAALHSPISLDKGRAAQISRRFEGTNSALPDGLDYAIAEFLLSATLTCQCRVEELGAGVIIICRSRSRVKEVIAEQEF